MEAGTLSQGNLGTATPALTMAALPPRVNLARCANRARVSIATGMHTTAFREASRFFALCTKTWDTSTCITRCAPGLAAIRGRTTATQEAGPSTVSRTRSPVSAPDYQRWSFKPSDPLPRLAATVADIDCGTSESIILENLGVVRVRAQRLSERENTSRRSLLHDIVCFLNHTLCKNVFDLRACCASTQMTVRIKAQSAEGRWVCCLA